MKKKQFIIDIESYTNQTEIPNSDQKLIDAAKQACDKAYAPYSQFKVGAAVLLDDGTIITGTNQENAAYPSGLCAERTALFYANSQYPNNAVVALAIVAKNKGEYTQIPVGPCGACRQVILETENRFNKNIRIIMNGKKETQIVKNAKSLLPVSFSDKDLM
jgi:cytidine deaminase